MRQLDVRNLKLRALAAQNRVVFAPVELERFPGPERQGHERAAPRSLLLALTVCAPPARKGGDAPVRTREAERHQIGMKLLERPLLLARRGRFGTKPCSQLDGERIKLARPLRRGEPRFDSPAFKCFVTVFRDRPVRRAISRIDRFSRNAMRRMMFKSPRWITPLPPVALSAGEGVTWLSSQ